MASPENIAITHHKFQVKKDGFSIISGVYSAEEIKNLIAVIDATDISADTFRKSADLFAIRQFLREIPATISLIFNNRLQSLIKGLFGENYFAVKSIYFDKPGASNWFVAYHQDLTISVDKKIEMEGFGSWTAKQNQYAVQPPLDILESIFTIRIHLDDTTTDNGALKVIPKSHAEGVYRPETVDWNNETETTCEVSAGGVMIMKPLLLHSSARSTNNKRRRVIHIEFCNKELPESLQWAERTAF